MNSFGRVAAFDAGYKNFACCVLSSDYPLTPLLWRRFALSTGRNKPSTDTLIRALRRFFEENAELFKTCTHFVVEKQMREKMFVINAVVQCLIRERFDKAAVEVAPRTFSQFWQFPSTRDLKKEAAVTYVKRLGVIFPDERKLDDLADAFWLAALVLVETCAVGYKVFRPLDQNP